MALPKKVCIHCQEEFVVVPNKPGRINECLNCVMEMKTETFIIPMAKVSYPCKNASEVQIEIVYNNHVSDAKKFNASQRHHWCKPA